MQETTKELFRACFAAGLIADTGAVKVIPARLEPSGFGVLGGDTSAIIEEWHIPTREGAEVIARKVIALDAAAYWVRVDLLDRALAWIAEGEARLEREKADLINTLIRADQAAADRAGLPLGEYRRRRNAVGAEMDRRSGKYAWMGR